jgi:hypothetical protein
MCLVVVERAKDWCKREVVAAKDGGENVWRDRQVFKGREYNDSEDNTSGI